MKRKFSLIGIVGLTLLASEAALACAGCLDIYAEKVVLSDSATVQVVQQMKTQTSFVARLNNLICTRTSVYSEVGEQTTCSLELTINEKSTSVSLNDEAAVDTLKKLADFKAEIDNSQDSEVPPKRTYKKVSLGNRIISGEQYTFSMNPYIAEMICSVRAGKAKACTMEFRTLTVMDIPVQP